MSSQIRIRGKKGISVMIGYILLVTFAIIISVIIYNWMQSYVPKEDLQCEDGVSLIVQEYSCNSNELNITVRNSGRFNVTGLIIHGKENASAELATLDLSENTSFGGYNSSGKVLFSPNSQNTLGPGVERDMGFDISSYDKIKGIEITPVRFVEVEGKSLQAVCGDARISESVDC